MAAIALLKDDTLEAYECSTTQYTITPMDNHSYIEILNEDGLNLLMKIFKRLRNGIYYDVLSNYKFLPSPSGEWIRDTDNPYSKEDALDLDYYEETWNNYRVQGDKKNGDTIKTNILRFYDKDDGWAYTISDHLYKLQNMPPLVFHGPNNTLKIEDENEPSYSTNPAVISL